MKPTAMTIEERQAFLAQPWVAILSVAEPGRGPLCMPVWYLYEPGGEVQIWTGPNTRKVRLLRAAGRISLCVQDPRPPYRYITVEGPVQIEPVDYQRAVRPLAYRYFGPEQGEAYLASLGGQAGTADDLLVRLVPEHWQTVDYSKLSPPPK